MKYFIFETIFLLTLCVNLFVDGTPFKDCSTTKVSKLLNVSVPGCNTGPCNLAKGTNASFSIEFRAGAAYPSVKAVVHGIIDEIPIPFPVPNANACKNSNLKCPLVKGKTYQYNDVIQVLTAYPDVKAVVKWELQDDKKNDIVCVEVPIAITG